MHPVQQHNHPARPLLVVNFMGGFELAQMMGIAQGVANIFHFEIGLPVVVNHDAVHVFGHRAVYNRFNRWSQKGIWYYGYGR